MYGFLHDPFGYWGNAPEIPDNDSEMNGYDEGHYRVMVGFLHALATLVLIIIGIIIASIINMCT